MVRELIRREFRVSLSAVSVGRNREWRRWIEAQLPLSVNFDMTIGLVSEGVSTLTKFALHS
jgi:hypothetical protein